MEGKLIAVGYTRVSSHRQVSDGDGLGLQRSRIEGWCAYQGVSLEVVHEDAGISGAAIDNRPAFRAALRAVLALGPRGVLVVYRLDRLGRNAIDVQQTLEVLLHAGVRVVALADGIDSASGMGTTLLRLLTTLLSTFAEIERTTITGRLQDGRRRADAEGRIYAVEPRFGRRVSATDPRLLVEDDDEQRALARMRELQAEGLSYRRIATTLDAEGHRPRRATRWSHVTVRTILTGKRSKRRTAVADRIDRARAALLGDAPQDAPVAAGA